jgi:GTP-binding protein HflX
LVTDTVGFIRKLPPAIITAFRATLEELTEASLLIHVVDLASPSAPEQCQTVEKILGDLDLSDKPLITVLNKIDLLLKQGENWDEASALSYFSDQPQDENTLLISSIKGWGLAELLKLINQTLTNSAQSN